MSVFIPVIILILVALILCLLQLSPGVFTLFYHYALGKHSRQKADDLSLDFILGAETITAIIWSAIYAIFFTIFYYNPTFNSSIILWIIAGILFAEAIITFLFYYRKGTSTAHFIPRSVAHTFALNAKRTKTRSEAFLLGFTSRIPEFIFTIPVFLLISYILAYSTVIPSAITIILFVIISTLQLFVIRIAYRTHHHLADIQRVRVKAKPFIRIILPICLTMLSIATIYLGISYYG